MIEFECPHCSNVFTVGPELAGRHGWCRVCKGLIEVPGDDADHPSTNLTPEHKIKILEKLLRYAGTRFERDRKELLAMHEKYEQLTQREDLTESLERKLTRRDARLTEAQRVTDKLTADLEAAAASRGAVEAEVVYARAEAEQLRETAEKHQADIDSLTSQLADSEASLARLKEEMATVGSDSSHADTRLADLSLEVEQLTKTLEAAQARIAEAEEGHQPLRSQVTELETTLALEREAAAALRDQVEKSAELARDTALLEGRIQDNEQTTARLTSELSAAAEKLGKAQAEADQAKSQSEQAAKDLAASLSAQNMLSDQVQDLQTSCQVAERESERLSQELIAVKGQFTDLEGQYRDAKIQAAEREVFEQDRDRIAQRLTEAEAQADRLKGDLKQALNATATDDVQAVASVDVAEAQSALEDERATRREAEAALEQATKATKEAMARADEGVWATERLVEEQKILEAKVVRVDAIEQDLRIAEARLEESQSQVERLTSEIAAQASRASVAETPAPPDGAAASTKGDKKADRAADKDDGISLIPEVVDGDEADDEVLMDSLLRFIEPSQ